MNPKQLLIMVAVALVLGGGMLYLNKQKSESFQRGDRIAGEKLLGDFPVNDVTHITLRQPTGEVNLVRTEAWTVKERDGYPANEEDIIEFARKLWSLQAAQSQKIGESQLGRLALLAPGKGDTNAGTLVELKGKDGKLIKSVILGKNSMRDSGESSFGGGGGYPNGRWLYVPDKPGTAYLVSEAFSEIKPNPEHWLKKDFFKVEKLKAVSVTHTNATNSWKLTRETENGMLALADAKPGEQLDSGKSSPAGNALSYATFTDVVPQANAEETGLDHPLVAQIETFDGFNYTVKVGKKTPEENYYLNLSVSADLPKERPPGKDEKPEDKEKLDKEFKDKMSKLDEKLKQEKTFEKWTYLVSKWTVDPLLKDRKDLLAEKKEEPKKDEKAPPQTGAPFDVNSTLTPPLPVAEPKKE